MEQDAEVTVFANCFDVFTLEKNLKEVESQESEYVQYFAGGQIFGGKYKEKTPPGGRG